jgi:diaminopimelate decarboxylase
MNDRMNAPMSSLLETSDHSQLIFSDADVVAVAAAIEAFCHSICVLAGPFSAQIAYAQSRAPLIIAKARSGDVSGAIQWAVLLADACLLDEIRPENYSVKAIVESYLWTDLAAQYYRFFGGQVWLPASLQVALSARHPMGTQFYLMPAGADLFTTRPRARMTPRLDYVTSDNETIIPTMGVCRQQVISELLRCGINYFEGWQPANTKRCIREERPPASLRRYQRILDRVMAGGLSDVEALAGRTSRHWANVLNEPCLSEPSHPVSFAFANSGCAANEAVIRVLSRVLPQARCYLHPYWYFENKAACHALFHDRLEVRAEDATVFFLNPEAVSHHDFQSGAASPDPHELLRYALDRARQGSETVVVVVDVTQQPSVAVMDFACTDSQQWPPNFLLVKTCSLTKWQRGARNYFSGMAVFINDSSCQLGDQVSREIAAMGCESSVYHGLQVARVRERELLESSTHCRRLAEGFARTLAAPPGWQVLASGQLVFIVPSADVLKSMNQCISRLRTLAGDAQAKMFVAASDRKIATRLARITELENFPNIETGNSFGLPVTRVIYDIGLVVVDGQRIGVGGIRLAPGWATSDEELAAFGVLLVPSFQEALKQALSALEQEIIKQTMLAPRVVEPRWHELGGSGPAVASDTVVACLDAIWHQAAHEYDGPSLFFSRAKMNAQAERLRFVSRELSIHFLAAVKSGALIIYPAFAEDLQGFDVSNVTEFSQILELADGKEVFVTSPVLLQDANKIFDRAMDANIRVTMICDSLTQLEHYPESSTALRFGLRLDSAALLANVDGAEYEMAVLEKSRFGVSALPDELLPLFSTKRICGVHVHHGSERNQLLTYLRLIHALKSLFESMAVCPEFISLGGGIHLLSLRDFSHLSKVFSKAFPSTQLYMEPGRYLTQGAGYAVAQVLSVKEAGLHTLLTLDLSSECHLKWSEPSLWLHSEPRSTSPLVNDQALSLLPVVVFGVTCFESDVVGKYSLPTNATPALFDKLVLGNISSYSLAWNTGFNGVAPIRCLLID